MLASASGFPAAQHTGGNHEKPLPVAQGLAVLQSWPGHPGSVLVQPGIQHATDLADLLLAAGRGGTLVSDAHLAALAMEHSVTLLSFDSDFAQFGGLQFTHLRLGGQPLAHSGRRRDTPPEAPPR